MRNPPSEFDWLRLVFDIYFFLFTFAIILVFHLNSIFVLDIIFTIRVFKYRYIFKLIDWMLTLMSCAHLDFCSHDWTFFWTFFIILFFCVQQQYYSFHSILFVQYMVSLLIITEQADENQKIWKELCVIQSIIHKPNKYNNEKSLITVMIMRILPIMTFFN